jgi:multidrug efflux pump subunit AcrA (membrane-fusion protein)
LPKFLNSFFDEKFKAVQSSHNGRRFVWLAVDSTAQRRFVETGTLADSGVTVEKGLHEGDRLIVEGYQKISEGMKINSQSLDFR